jgi:hypothetical protein
LIADVKFMELSVGGSCQKWTQVLV